ncbi:MAG: amino acid synthesis family protein [Dongiaceae bacterium]
MSLVQVRKFATVVEEIFHEGGPPPAKALKQGACLAVISNPYSGKYVADILPLMAALNPLGVEMARRLLAAIGVGPREIEGYGKGAIVGAAGELEHGALWHAPGGYGMREVLGGTKAIVPSTKKVGGRGARLDVPVCHVNAAYVRSHFSAMELGLADAPQADEMVLILVMTTGPRIHARAGGLTAAEIKGEDGLR